MGNCQAASLSETNVCVFLQTPGSMEPDHAGPAAEAEGVAACKALFAQMPWEDIAQLDVTSIRNEVLLPLVQFLQKVAKQASLGNADAAELLQSTMTVTCKIPQKTDDCSAHFV